MSKNKKKILIVDDEIDFTKSTSHRLNFEGYDTIEAMNAKEALAILEKTVPDIILLDVMMPGMTGVQFFEQLRKDARFKNIPVIFLTVWDRLVSSDSHGTKEKAVLVTKPFEFDTLLKTIREMISS